ncbi:MAG TPA: hypothetical protein VFQ54_04805, partial [Thermomicrobiales bacterium]|nr:hypothetical protein [Thermomicrobiales bacterium]
FPDYGPNNYRQGSLSYQLVSAGESVTLTFANTENAGPYIDDVSTSCTNPTPTETNTPVSTRTDTPTAVPSDTPNPTGTGTTLPTGPGPVAPTPTSTTAPPTSTVIPSPDTGAPNSTATIVPSVTVAPSSTSVPTGTAETTGSVTLILTTSDGGPVPNGAIVCVGDQCQAVGASVSSAAVGTTLTFVGLDPGTYPLTVTNAAPYLDATGSVTVTAESTTNASIVLQLAAVTVTTVPTEPGAATPIVTGTAGPTQAPGDGNAIPTQRAGGSDGAAPPSRTDGAPAVKALPNTGAGGGSSDASLTLLLLAIVAVAGGGILTWRRRRI